jgi:CHAD domain-containing protein
MSDSGEGTTLLRERLTRLAAAVHDAEAAARAEDPEGVHDLRVAMRRTRSLLTTFGPLLDAEAADSLKVELRWAAAELSTLRDLEVIQERLEELLDTERSELLLGGVATRVADHDREQARAERESLDRLLADDRWAALLARLADDSALHRMVDEEISGAALRARVLREWRRLRRRARAVDRAGADHDGDPAARRAREEALHETRKAAKRLRYAAEAMVPAYGSDAERTAERAKAVQQALGDHRDTLLTRPVLRQLGVQAHLDGDNGFTFGRWHGLEQARGAAALEAYQHARRRVEKKKVRSWLT